MASGSSADTTMTFGAGEVAMPAAGESTVDEATTISVDSVTTEEEKKKKPSASSTTSRQRARARSAPRAPSQTRSASSGTRPKPSERRPSRTVIQCLQATTKNKDREVKSPDQQKSRSSSRSTSRKGKAPLSPSPLVRRPEDVSSPVPVARDVDSPPQQGLGHADMVLERAIQAHQHGLREELSPLSIASQLRPQSLNAESQMIQQLVNAEQIMQARHNEEIRQHEATIAMLNARVSQMTQWIRQFDQEDQGSTMRIEELERQRDMMSSAMAHVNQTHQRSMNEYAHVLNRVEEASSAEHHRDEETAEALHHQLGHLRSEASHNFAQYEQRVQGEGHNMAKEYQKLTDELHEQARETLRLKLDASNNLAAATIMREKIEMIRAEELTAKEKANEKILAAELGVQNLHDRLAKEEFANSEANARMEQAELHARQAFEREIPVTALHSELGELRQRLKQQEELQSLSHQSWKQELEAERRLHLASQRSSNTALSSKTSETGWEFVGSRVGSQKGSSVPVGADVRSPDVSTSTQNSPVNRGKVIAESYLPLAPITQDVNMNPQGASHLPLMSEMPSVSAQRGMEARDNQLRDLLNLRGMHGGSTSSSSNTKPFKNIFMTDEDEKTEKLISELIEKDARMLDGNKAQDVSVAQAMPLARPGASSSSSTGASRYLTLIENDYIAQMTEMRIELQQAKKNEERLREDRNTWRQAAEQLQQENQDGEEDNGDDDEEVPPSESPSNLGPNGPGGGGDDDGDRPRKHGRRGDPDPPPHDDDPGDDDDDYDVKETKISRREADKVVVPSFPKVTHLDSWMSACIAGVLSASGDPNHEDWIEWLAPAFGLHPDIEALGDSGPTKFKSIDVKLALAMQSMLKSAGDNASDLFLDVNRRANKSVRTHGKLIKGRQIIAMMYESFRTRDRIDMIMTID